MTILTSPKAFDAQFGPIQERSISSWKKIHPEVDIILFGESPGAAECAERWGLRHVRQIESSASGVPLFNAIVGYAEENGKFARQVYLNADILLPPWFGDVTNPAGLPEYLIAGQRIDLTEGTIFEPEATGWMRRLEALNGDGKASLHMLSGSDYFVFPAGLWRDLPPLVIGRGGYDNALLAYCLRRGIPVIDGTLAIPAVHQWHDYSHVESKAKEVFFGEDAKANTRNHNIVHGAAYLSHADRALLGDGTRVENPRRPLFQKLEVALRFRRNFQLLGYASRMAWRFLRPINRLNTRSLSLGDLIEARRDAA